MWFRCRISINEAISAENLLCEIPSFFTKSAKPSNVRQAGLVGDEMVSAEKRQDHAKTGHELGNTLREIVRRDIADEARRFNDTLTKESNSPVKRSFMLKRKKQSAGASSINGKLEKAHRGTQK